MIEKCVEGESGSLERVEVHCKDWERCVEGEEGPGCQPILGPCQDGDAYCSEKGHAIVCERGRFTEWKCEEGCSETTSGSRCKITAPGTRVFRGELFYEHRIPNPGLTDWAEPVERPAAGLFVFSMHRGAPISETRVAWDGSYEVLVPEEPELDDDEGLVFVAMGNLLGPASPHFSVANPDLPAGMHDIGDQGKNVSYWNWMARPTPENARRVIRLEEGSGAIQIFSGLQRSVGMNAIHYGTVGPDVVGVFHPEVEWNCGACYGGAMQSMKPIFYSGGATGSVSSDSVILHEAGHYALDAYGSLAWEAGQHCLGVPAMPGQAFSEGHASWYSADLRKDPILYAKRDTTFYYWDIQNRLPNNTARPYFTEPDPELGLLQKTNETWVSSIFWDLAKTHGSNALHWKVLASPRMTVPPFERGYLAHRWWEVDSSCLPIDPEETEFSVPILADFLDALVCEGFPAAIVDSVVLPAYPYPSHSPLCR